MPLNFIFFKVTIKLGVEGFTTTLKTSTLLLCYFKVVLRKEQASEKESCFRPQVKRCGGSYWDFSGGKS
jgi:hypothetical protein